MTVHSWVVVVSKPWKYSIFILIVLVIALSVNIFSMNDNDTLIYREIVSTGEPEKSIKRYTLNALHSPLVIDSNLDFETNGWAGEGTEGSPYCMEDIEIMNDSVVVSISNTDAFFIIRDCNFTFTGVVGSCIAFSNVQNGVIENCTIVSSYIGIEMDTSQSCAVIDCRIGPCGGFGIHLYESSHIQVSQNEIMDIAFKDTGSYDSGIFLHSTDDSIISENIVSNAPHDIVLASSDRIEVLSNDISHPTMYDAIVTVFTNDCIIRGNVISASSRGMSLNHDYSCLIENNTITVYNDRGIGVRYGHDFVVRNNNVSGSLFGYDFQGLDNFIITDNIAHHSHFGLSISDFFTSSKIFNNTAYDCDFGFFTQGSIPGASFVGCTAYNNDRGFYIQSAAECGFYNNIAYENNVGFELAHEGFFELIGNAVFNNSLYGISIWDTCSNNTICRNFIFSNRVLDNGFNNTWDNGVDQGNYWDDYSGIGYYDIPGTAGSQDRYPGIYPDSYPMPMVLDAATVTYEYNTTGNTITWQVLSIGIPDYYEVYQEDILISKEDWDGMDIVYPVDGLDIGWYNFTLIVYDWLGNSDMCSGAINVTESTGSEITTITTTPTSTTIINGTLPDLAVIAMMVTTAAGAAILVVAIVIIVKHRP